MTLTPGPERLAMRIKDLREPDSLLFQVSRGVLLSGTEVPRGVLLCKTEKKRESHSYSRRLPALA